MTASLSVLIKSIVLPFYRSHAGLLLFVFFVMFGTVESNQLVHYHRSLVEATFTTPLFRTGVILLWALYSLKVFQFILSRVRQPEYAFMGELALLPKPEVLGLMFILNTLCLIPILLYSIFLYGVGIEQGYFITSIQLIFVQFMLCALPAGLLVFYLASQHMFSWSILSGVRFPTPSGRWGIYMQHILHHEKTGLLISKVFSIVLLYIVKETLVPDDDVRIVGITWMFVLLAHTFIVLKIKLFEDQYLLWVKNLPISILKTWLFYGVLYAALLAPEWILLAGSISKGLTLQHYLLLPLLSGAWLTCVHTYLFKPNRNVEQFTTWLFWFFLVSFTMILFSLATVFVVVLAALSFWLLYKRYYACEPPQP